MLAFFQASAIALNLLPFPGLDGFGIIRPFLLKRIAAATTAMGTVAFVVLMLLLWYTPLGGLVSSLALDITGAFSITTSAIARGFSAMRVS